MSGDSNIIDLTESFSLIDHCQLANLVIELDDSLSNSPLPRPQPSQRSHSRTKLTKDKKQPLPPQNSKKMVHPKRIGDCPVCWDELGKNPIASTKCGHVFCIHCIEQVVKQTKRCPTCRCILKGTSAYHPLYLCLE